MMRESRSNLIELRLKYFFIYISSGILRSFFPLEMKLIKFLDEFFGTFLARGRSQITSRFKGGEG